MFSGKTTFVVGAGASKEADLPTGEELKEEIIDLLTYRSSEETYSSSVYIAGSRNSEIFDIFRRAPPISNDDDRGQNFHKMKAAALKIAGALPGALSIDNYINQMAGNPYIELCGKVAIVRAILHAERNSRLYVSLDNAYNKLDLTRLNRDVGDKPRREATWYLKLSQLLFEDCRQEELEERLSGVSFIIFNYDRCVEHFLYWVLRRLYDLTAEQAASLVNGIPIFHPYGTVGALPWQGKAQASVHFGQTENYDLLRAASGIKTFTEGTDPSQSEIVDLRSAMDLANTVIFLGFGFHNQNMELITPKTTLGALGYESKRYFGTAAGLSNSDVEIVTRYLQEMCSVKASGSDIQLRQDCYCNKLFEEYQRSFSLDPLPSPTG